MAERGRKDRAAMLNLAEFLISMLSPGLAALGGGAFGSLFSPLKTIHHARFVDD